MVNRDVIVFDEKRLVDDLVVGSDESVHARAVRLLMDVIEWNDSHQNGPWEQAMYRIGEGSLFVGNRPSLGNDHVKLLLESGLVSRVPWGEASALRFFDGQREKAERLIAVYAASLPNAAKDSP